MSVQEIDEFPEWPVVYVERSTDLALSWTASSWTGRRCHIGIGNTRRGALRSLRRDQRRWAKRNAATTASRENVVIQP